MESGRVFSASTDLSKHYIKPVTEVTYGKTNPSVTGTSSAVMSEVKRTECGGLSDWQVAGNRDRGLGDTVSRKRIIIRGDWLPTANVPIFDTAVYGPNAEHGA